MVKRRACETFGDPRLGAACADGLSACLLAATLPLLLPDEDFRRPNQCRKLADFDFPRLFDRMVPSPRSDGLPACCRLGYDSAAEVILR
jgi:hypothetical protein